MADTPSLWQCTQCAYSCTSQHLVQHHFRTYHHPMKRVVVEEVLPEAPPPETLLGLAETLVALLGKVGELAELVTEKAEQDARTKDADLPQFLSEISLSASSIAKDLREELEDLKRTTQGVLHG